MKTIQVYDPPMCCSTGLCGTEIDPVLGGIGVLSSKPVGGNSGSSCEPGCGCH
jgi:hypothetical protein